MHAVLAIGRVQGEVLPATLGLEVEVPPTLGWSAR